MCIYAMRVHVEGLIAAVVVVACSLRVVVCG